MTQPEIARLLPAVFQQTLRPGSPLAALLAVMEALHAPAEEALEEVDTIFNPYLAPEHVVPFLARWVDLDRLLAGPGDDPDAARTRAFPGGLGRLREAIASAAALSRLRGTREGLRRFLEIATGAEGFEIEEHVGADGRPRAYHLLIRAPAETEPYRDLLDRIVAMEKPAYMTSQLLFKS